VGLPRPHLCFLNNNHETKQIIKPSCNRVEQDPIDHTLSIYRFCCQFCGHRHLEPAASDNTAPLVNFSNGDSTMGIPEIFQWKLGFKKINGDKKDPVSGD
jgi:hypothetical protein